MSSAAARSASRTASSTESRSTPGIESTGTRRLAPSTMNSGQIRSSVVSTFSRTMRRAHSDLRLRRMPGGEVERRGAAPGGLDRAQPRAASIGRPNLMAMAASPEVVPAVPFSRFRRSRLATGARVTGFHLSVADGRDHRMDFELSEEQRAIQDTAREFARAEMMPHARDWDENATFPVETLRKAAALGFGGIYVQDDVGGSALTRLDATHHLRGAGAGLHLDRGLHLDPQHGGLDDRRVRRARRSGDSFLPKLCTMEHFASYCLTEPDCRLGCREPEDARDARRRPLRAQRHQGVHLGRRRLRHLCLHGAHRRGRAARHLVHRGREGHARALLSARRRRSSAGNRSRPRW